MRRLPGLASLLLAILAIHAEEKIESLPSDCGRFLNFKYFIGELTELDDYPWLALLEYDTPRGKLTACGGVLLSNRYVLTAGHCASHLGANWTLTSVRLGEYDLTTSPDCLPDGNAENTTTCIPDYVSIKIDKSIVHEKYSRRSRRYDIALLRLADDVVFSEYIKPICLPKKDPEPQKFHAAGWGKLAGKRGSDVKLRSSLSLSNSSTCVDSYKKERVFLAEDQFCAGGQENEKPCVADSGGPLMGVDQMEDESYKMAVFGILTLDSRFCGLQDRPGVYIDVLTYRNWILEHLK